MNRFRRFVGFEYPELCRSQIAMLRGFCYCSSVMDLKYLCIHTCKIESFRKLLALFNPKPFGFTDLSWRLALVQPLV
jgi:hypothetical protein